MEIEDLIERNELQGETYMKCCKCGKVANPIVLLGKFRKWAHCQECADIIGEVDEKLNYEGR